MQYSLSESDFVHLGTWRSERSPVQHNCALKTAFPSPSFMKLLEAFAFYPNSPLSKLHSYSAHWLGVSLPHFSFKVLDGLASVPGEPASVPPNSRFVPFAAVVTLGLSDFTLLCFWFLSGPLLDMLFSVACPVEPVVSLTPGFSTGDPWMSPLAWAWRSTDNFVVPLPTDPESAAVVSCSPFPWGTSWSFASHS
jgi:hypothetical protein